MPKVSVIIPAYRAEKFIVRTVESLLQQSLADWEAIIISDDGTNYQKLLSANKITDKRLRFGSTGKPASGPSNARNIAQDMAKSEIIATLDADDTFDKRKLEMMVPLAKKHGLAISNIRVIDNETNAELPNLQYAPHTRLIKYNELLVATAYSNSTLVYKKTKKLLYWATEISHCEDLLFITQIYDHYGKAFYFRHKLHNYYLHNDSLCRAKDATANFLRDRGKIISRLKNNKVYIKDKDIREKLIKFVQAGQEIDKKYGKKIFSYEVYLSELRKLCSFLPSATNWKIT